MKEYAGGELFPGPRIEYLGVEDVKEGKEKDKMFSMKKISWRRILMALSLVALLGVASCGAHAGGHVGGVGGDVGASAGSR